MDTSINDTFGAMFIGAMITMAIYGITTLQAYFYYMTYPHDAKHLKILVAIIWILDTTHVVFMSHAMHHYLISGYGNPTFLLEGTWSLYSSILLNVIIAFLVQIFFTKRIHDLCPEKYRWYLSSVVLLMVVAHFVFGVETVIQFYIKKAFSRLNEVNYVAVLPFGVTAILSDIFIAVGLCVLLEQNRSDYEDTNYLISTLVGYAITRCLLTSVVAVVEVVVFVTMPHSFYSFAIDFVIGKLWANSLLASLNSRRALRDRSKKTSGTSSGDVSTGFEVAHRQTTTGLSEPGHISLVRIPRTGDESGPDEDIQLDIEGTTSTKHMYPPRISSDV